MDQNLFRFVFSYKSTKLAERVFESDTFNHSVRYSIRIADLSREMISDFRKILGSNNRNLNFNLNGYNLQELPNSLRTTLNIREERLENYLGPLYAESEMLELLNNRSTIENIKFTLFINNSIIIEREFSCFNFNPNSVFSTNLIETIDYWVDKIKQRVKGQDLFLQWDEYNLENHFGLTKKQIREMPEEERKHKLYIIKRKEETLRNMSEVDVEMDID